MSLADHNHPLAQLLKHDLRYKLDAYLFVLESLQFAQDSLGMGEEPSAEDIEPLRAGADPAAKPRARPGKQRRKQTERHLTGQQLCEAARQYALQQYGYMSRTVLATWGVRSTADLGEIVFNMIESGQMRKTRKDKREDFHDVYDFSDAFSRDLSFVVPDSV
ncbi:MAG: Minf_1886 family protein [Planctomycetota bacterium]